MYRFYNFIDIDFWLYRSPIIEILSLSRNLKTGQMEMEIAKLS